MTLNKEKGNFGEEFACKRLKEMGLEVLATNYHSRYGEIDIIAIDKEDIAFIEVKVRQLGALQTPIEAVDKNKQTKIIKTAQEYIKKHNLDLYSRFDVFEVYTKFTENYVVEHYEYIQYAFDNSTK